MAELNHPVRINELLQLYWQELKGNRPLPLEHEVSAEALKDIWNSCFLVVKRHGSFAYEYLGTDLLDAYGDDLTGKEITEALLYPHPKSLFEAFQAVSTTALPAMDEGEFTNARGQVVKYRSCVLPLAAQGGDGVAFLLGGMKWKAY